MNTPRLIVIAAALALCASGAPGPLPAAHADPIACAFSSSAPAQYGALGGTAELLANGSVGVRSRAVYYTDQTVEVGLWIDDSFAQLAPDAPALALSYFEHANCIFAAGKNKLNLTGWHKLSLRIAGNRVRYFPISTPPAFQGRPWLQQVHWDWRQQLAMPRTPKVNLLITARQFAEKDQNGVWGGVGGATNGIGQGQAIITVDPAIFRNGMANDRVRPLIEDWWGVISAHELGHALGIDTDTHTLQKFDTMCCAAPLGYTQEEIGFVPSRDFSVSGATYASIYANHTDTTDQCVDPYASAPNPMTNVLWSYNQISSFLTPYISLQAVGWVSAHEPVNCRNAASDPSLIQCRTLSAYQTCLSWFPYSPTCDLSGASYGEPCCALQGGW